MQTSIEIADPIDMGARSGNNYLSAIRKQKSESWLYGERIVDVITHPALVHDARMIASLYDAQIQRPAAMTYRLDDGDRVGLSFIQPQNCAELQKRALMCKLWAECSGESLDYAPDALNSALAAMATASKFFAASDPRFDENIQNFYRAARHHDWCMTSNLTEFHRGEIPTRTLLDTQRLKIVARDSHGLQISGAVELIMPGSLAEELLVLSSPAGDSAEIVFAINCNAPGLRFVHRRSPFSIESLSDKLEYLAIFDHVSTPNERIFLYDDAERYRAMLTETDATVSLLHHAAIRAVVKAEMMVKTSSSSASSDSARIAKWRDIAKTLQSCISAASDNAYMNQWGMFVPAREPLEEALNLFRRVNRDE